MRRLFPIAAMAALTAPVLADDQAEQPRLSELEHIIVTSLKEEPAERLTELEHIIATSLKEEPAEQRLTELEHMIITAPKEQPADHEIDDTTAAILAEIAVAE